MNPAAGLLAVDVGSSCVKLGWFPPARICTSADAKPLGQLPIAAAQLPRPEEVFESQHRDRSPEIWLAEIERWTDGLSIGSGAICAVASVHGAAADALEEGLRSHGAAAPWRLVNSDVPIIARVAEPARVGIDRLLGALAASRLKPAGSPAIVVDMGTAITIDLVADDGSFEGGAILAGPYLSLAALHGGTMTLPRLDADAMAELPRVVGKSTTEAMASGAYWGTLGAVEGIIGRMAEAWPSVSAAFVTGGAAAAFAPRIGRGGLRARYEPYLVLSGIRLAVESSLLAT
ncbi:MAG: type III pantothenate kinase [Pirellulales bacterium]|nr:type III pantothenate kinase [Pirellulales bacterium]